MVHKIRSLPAIGKVLELMKYGIYFNFLLDYYRIPASPERSQWKKTKQIEWALQRRRNTCLFIMWPFWAITLGIVSGKHCSKAKEWWGFVSSRVIEAMTEGAALDFHSPSLSLGSGQLRKALPFTCRGLPSAAFLPSASPAACGSSQKWASSGPVCSWSASGEEWTAPGTSLWQGCLLIALHG